MNRHKISVRTPNLADYFGLSARKHLTQAIPCNDYTTNRRKIKADTQFTAVLGIETSSWFHPAAYLMGREN
jgi:hypothetical protein